MDAVTVPRWGGDLPGMWAQIGYRAKTVFRSGGQDRELSGGCVSGLDSTTLSVL